jgi:hypothetical protein
MKKDGYSMKLGFLAKPEGKNSTRKLTESVLLPAINSFKSKPASTVGAEFHRSKSWLIRNCSL